MILNTVKHLTPVRLILNLQALKSNNLRTSATKYCLGHSVHSTVEEKPTQGDPGRATKVLYQLLAKNVTHETQQGFYRAFPNIIQDILKLSEFQHDTGVKERLKQIILYNTPPHTHFSMIQAAAVSDFYEDLRSQGLPAGSIQHENHLQKTFTLAWCAELITSAFLIMDDIADGSTIRHGQPSWHTIQEPSTTNFIAVNDALLLSQAAIAHVERTIARHPAQQKLSQVFRQAIAYITSSYAMENIIGLKFKTTGKICSMNDYCRMRKLQNGYLLTIPSITSVVILNGITHPLQLKQLEAACMDLALYFAIQRDYMDSFHMVKHVGNDGTDLQNAKITWLLIAALERASLAQRKQIQENIGKSSDSNVKAVLEVFQELEIPKLHNDWQQNFYDKITTKINNLPETLPRKFLQHELVIFKRALSH